MTLLELAERCEQATGPDRELDCLTWCATAESHFEYYGGDCVLAVQGGFSARLDWKDIPHPTASLDAAMTLVPENWCVASLEWWPMNGIKSSVTLREVRESDIGSGYDETCWKARARGELPSLAIAAAALRARHSIQESA